jgi:hypothetical protein
MNRVHPTCTERPSLNQECGWKGGDRGGLAPGNHLEKEEIKKKKEKKRKEKKRLTLTGLLMEGLRSDLPDANESFATLSSFARCFRLHR